MPEPQLSIRSAKARQLAHALARRTGQTMSHLVEQALEHYDRELRQKNHGHPIDAVWDLACEDRQGVKAGSTGEHSGLYDEAGLPR